jgi:phenylpropionate dioxygenase-like ring-hydroxylating dioxygenase large terminal subunit
MEGWIALTRTSTLGTQPRRVTLNSKDYVVWRNHKNDVKILPDACKHRGASLSLGKVLADGYVECPYHGWKYTEKKLCKPWADCAEHLQVDFDKKDRTTVKRTSRFVARNGQLSSRPGFKTISSEVVLEAWAS